MKLRKWLTDVQSASSAQTDGIPLTVYPEQFLLPPRDVSEEQTDFVVSQQLQLRNAYFEDLVTVWKWEYLHQVLGAKGEVWHSKLNPLQIGEVVLIGDDDKRHTRVGQKVFSLTTFR